MPLSHNYWTDLLKLRLKVSQYSYLLLLLLLLLLGYMSAWTLGTHNSASILYVNYC